MYGKEISIFIPPEGYEQGLMQQQTRRNHYGEGGSVGYQKMITCEDIKPTVEPGGARYM
jgi:hypothetical protein